MTLNDTTLLVFGGSTDEHPENFVYVHKISVNPTIESFTGFFLEFPDPLRPHDYKYTKVRLVKTASAMIQVAKLCCILGLLVNELIN